MIKGSIREGGAETGEERRQRGAIPGHRRQGRKVEARATA